MMQHTNHLLMIQPVNFGFNEQTAVNNSFQQHSAENLQQQALEEFNAFVTLLRKHKVDVTVVKDSAYPFTPDSIFPNNWISFHEDGKLFLYPMFAPNRRAERKAAVLDTIKKQFVVSEIIDLSPSENEDLFLEGTGSMVLDRDNKIAYACISPRTNEKVLAEFCMNAGYKPVIFNAVDATGSSIYHTNVMMCIASSFAVACLDAIPVEKERNELIMSLASTGKEIISISMDQMNSFAGNMLQVKNTDDELLLVMSEQAFDVLNNEQLEKLRTHNPIIHSPLTTIETAGGGSARCMIAEVYLKPR